MTIPVRALTRTIDAVEDSTVHNLWPNQNQGGTITLRVDHIYDSKHEVVIKFDLSTISDIFYEAQFGFEVESLGGPINISIYEMESTWTEMGVTWNNVPPLGTHITDLYIDDTVFYLINITIYAGFVFLAQLESLSLRLTTNEAPSESNWVKIVSRETSYYNSPAQRPQIRFYDTISEPLIGINLSIFITIGIISGVIGIITCFRSQYRRK